MAKRRSASAGEEPFKNEHEALQHVYRELAKYRITRDDKMYRVMFKIARDKELQTVGPLTKDEASFIYGVLLSRGAVAVDMVGRG